ncbi:hypothetical protein [Leptospira kirschneri]|uniref:Uncharacterized protein n=1 Tax=Leptospira kirschneri serovar Bulgarica str. Nikolaevo TaxID=1240687 RepID=M6FDD2_9LEPT|nr:hypothetical protein [Leptospira kirschneri]EMK24034.1 hypothetical protein LEP1GSC008_1178 [Leptospira kirschneri serovar Bulgarica str. Nikolaevo]
MTIEYLDKSTSKKDPTAVLVGTTIKSRFYCKISKCRKGTIIIFIMKDRIISKFSLTPSLSLTKKLNERVIVPTHSKS